LGADAVLDEQQRDEASQRLKRSPGSGRSSTHDWAASRQPGRQHARVYRPEISAELQVAIVEISQAWVGTVQPPLTALPMMNIGSAVPWSVPPTVLLHAAAELEKVMITTSSCSLGSPDPA
jgi:hypothetical protein